MRQAKTDADNILGVARSHFPSPGRACRGKID
jgi:hypothetical protein